MSMLQAQTLREFGGMVLANACGPCIGQWKRFVCLLSMHESVVPLSVCLKPYNTANAQHVFEEE